MFEGFKADVFVHGDYRIDFLKGGEGPALLLLHGYPQTRAIWHGVAPALSRHFTLIMPDLPGYGASEGPLPDAGNVAYSKRRVGEVMMALMAALGHERFLLGGHDRGARVAYRMALDQGHAVARLGLLDIVPTIEVWEEMDWRGAVDAFHWPLLAQPAPLAERLIGADPDHYVEHLLERWAGDRAALADEAVETYISQFHNQATVAATCADYRAGATVDMEHDRQDRKAGRRITCPTQVLWARGYHTTNEASPLTVWRRWADDVSEVSFPCGHFIAEECPHECADALIAFFSEAS